MAKVIDVPSNMEGRQVPTFPLTFKVKSGTAASIQPGYLVIKDGSNAGYYKAAPDGTNTDTMVQASIAVSASTETATADGTVTVVTAPILRLKIYAKTPGNLTASMVGTSYALGVNSGSYTLDQGTSSKGFLTLLNFDNTTNGLCDVLLNTHWPS